jgi:hypothetical protein
MWNRKLKINLLKHLPLPSFISAFSLLLSNQDLFLLALFTDLANLLVDI